MEVGLHSPYPKTQQRHRQGHLIQAHIPLSVIAKTLEKSLLPYITGNIPNTPMQHGYKTQHSTVMALHTLNNTVAKGFNQMAPPARTITVALDIDKMTEENVLDIYIYIYIYIYPSEHYGLSCLDLTDAIFFFLQVSLFCIHFHFCKYTLHVCYVFNIN